MKRKNPLASKKAYSPHYAEKKPFFFRERDNIQK